MKIDVRYQINLMKSRMDYRKQKQSPRLGPMI